MTTSTERTAAMERVVGALRTLATAQRAALCYLPEKMKRYPSWPIYTEDADAERALESAEKLIAALDALAPSTEEAMTEEREGSSCPFCASMYAPNTEHVCRQTERVREIAQEEIAQGYKVLRATIAEVEEKVAALESAKPSGGAGKDDVNNLRDEQVEWVVNNLSELGVKIGSQFFFLYKGRSLVYKEPEEGEGPYRWRPVGKREFGETCHPLGMDRVPDDYEKDSPGAEWGDIPHPAKCTGCEDRIADSDYHSCVPSEPGSETNAPQKMGRGAPPLSRGTGETGEDSDERLRRHKLEQSRIGYENGHAAGIEFLRNRLEASGFCASVAWIDRHRGALASGSRTEAS